MADILIIDKDRSTRNILKEKLGYEGYKTEAVERYSEAVMMCSQTSFRLALCDEEQFYLSMGQVPKIPMDIPVIVLSPNGNVESAVQIVKAGAYDFVTKPVDLNRLFGSVRTVMAASAETENKNTKESDKIQTQPPRRRNTRDNDIIGNSKQIERVKTLIEKVAPSDARVLITGANGTGKELVARLLHIQSNRASAPFIEVNCAAIPSELIESELFGHEKGAFTSAVKQRKGKFEQANGGTLFLDEIGDMSLSAQAKVLRALQENKITRVGSDNDIDVNVRILAATNKNLQDEIAVKNFREDLYHRLSVIRIHVPPLVERREDIPRLIEHFLEKLSKEHLLPKKEIDDDAVEELVRMEWTGNIRELSNVVERLVILSGDRITLQDVDMYAGAM